MTTRLSMIRDINGFNTFGLPFSDTSFQTKLSIGVPQSLTIPPLENANDSSYLAIFSFDPGSRVYVARNATATFPSLGFSNDVTELNPTARQVFPGDVLSFLTDIDTVVVNIQLYAI